MLQRHPCRLSSTSVNFVIRGRSGLSPLMIGRSCALEQLQGLLAVTEFTGMATDGPAIALISGEAGIGKSRLLREFIETLPSEVAVLAVQAQPGSLGRPFDVVAQLAPGDDDPGAAAMRVVRAAVANGRAVLLIEDLHWIDACSAQVIEQICAEPLPSLAVVGTYRGTDLSRKAPGGELVSRLERQHGVEQIRLDRLDRAEVSDLLAAIGNAVPSSAAVEAVYRRSGGIPFVVEELVRCCGPAACIDDLKSAQLPWSLEEAVSQQVVALAPEERNVVEALAVFGDPATFEVLSEVSELDESILLTALRSLCDRGVIVEHADDVFWFAHVLVSEAVHNQLLGRERRALHERALAALGHNPSPDHAALARHAQGAGRFELIPGIAREGAPRYLASGASFQALRLAAEALAEAPNDPALLAVATDAAWRLEYGTEALAYAQLWVANSVTDLDRVEALRFSARLHHELLQFDRRDEVLSRLEALAGELPAGMARGRCAGAVAQVHMLAKRSTEAVEWADRAIAEAKLNADPWLEAQASIEKASAFDRLHSREVSERALLEAHRLARQVGDDVLECRSLNNLLVVVSPHGPTGEWARRELSEAAKRCGFDKLGLGAVWEAGAAMARGDMRAMRQAEAELAERWDATEAYEAHRADLRIEEGLVAEARAAVKNCRVPHLAPDVELRTMRIEILAEALEGHRSAAEEALAGIVRSELPNDSAWAVVSMIEIGLAGLMAGIPAEQIRQDYLEGWIRPHVSHDFVALHLEGPLRLAEGDPAGAVAAFEEVLTDPDPNVYVPTLASLRTAQAAAQLAGGDRAGAIAAAKAAMANLAAWPGWRRDRAEALLRRLEGSSRTDGELTAREREVTALIAEGFTNGQVAERLFISPKTAAVHVSNILTKLGLSSRVEIAAWAVRHGVVLEKS